MSIGNSNQRSLGNSRGNGLGGADDRQDQTRIGSNVNRLINAIQVNSRTYSSSGQVDPNSGFSSYSYNQKRNDGIFGDMFGTAKELTDEQYRADIIDQASIKGTELYLSLQNRTGVYYNETRNAMEFFKRDRNRVVQPVFEQFINEVESNLQLYRFCASYASMFFAADLVTVVMSGNIEDFLNDPRKQLSSLHGNFVNVLCVQFLSWLEGHPEGINILHQMTPANRAMLDIFEGVIDGLQSKIMTMTLGNTTIPFPWRKGVIRRITERTQVKSATLEGFDFFGGEQPPSVWHGTGYTESRPSERNEAYDLLCQLTSRGHDNVNVKKFEPDLWNTRRQTDAWEDTAAPAVDVVKRLERMTVNNRASFNFFDYFVRVPGLDVARYLADPKIFAKIAPFMILRAEEDKPKFNAMGNLYQAVPLIRIDWENGFYDYEILPLGDYDMVTVLTNPKLVLPQIGSDARPLDVQSFDDYWEQTSQIKNDKDESVSLPECVKLEKVPDVLYGNKPVEITTNEEILSTMSSLSDHYDPMEQLAAFVIPFRARKVFQMESDIDADNVYKYFPSLVKEKCNVTTMREFHSELVTGLSSLKSDELRGLIISHVTNVVNRWLVECRFYPDNKDDPSFIALDNFIKDFDEFTQHLKDFDEPTLKSFFNLVQNEFLRENLTLFSQKESRDKHIKHELGKFKDELLTAKTKQMKSAMVIERDFIVAKINPMEPPSGWDRIIFNKSTLPAFDHVFRKSHETLMKHFDRHVPYLSTFSKDGNGKLWVTTPSEFDDKVYSLRPVSTISNIQLLNIAK